MASHLFLYINSKFQRLTGYRNYLLYFIIKTSHPILKKLTNVSVLESSIKQRITSRSSIYIWANPTLLVLIDNIGEEGIHLGINNTKILFYDSPLLSKLRTRRMVGTPFQFQFCPFLYNPTLVMKITFFFNLPIIQY